MPTNQNKKLFKRFILFVAVLAVSLGFAEIVARVMASRVVSSDGRHRDTLYTITEQGRRLVSSSSAVIRNHPISGLDVEILSNTLGFRDDELTVPKQPDELRVLVLGDSVTLQAYLPVGQTWVELAEKYLNSELGTPSYAPFDKLRAPAGRRNSESSRPHVELINTGIDGIGTKEQIDLLLERGLAAQPDVVLLAYYMNDACPPDKSVEAIPPPGFIRKHSVLADTLYRQVKLRTTAREGTPEALKQFLEVVNDLDWKGSKTEFDSLVESASDDWGIAWKDDAVAALREDLATLKELGSKHGFEVAMATFPVSFQVHADYPQDAPQAAISEVASELGVSNLDLLPGMRKYRKNKLFHDWCHPTDEASDLIARHVAVFLSKLTQGQLGQSAVALSLSNGAKEGNAPAQDSGMQDDVFTLYVLGGSTAFGQPYAPNADIGKIASLMLGGKIGGRPIKVRNLARIGYNSSDVLRSVGEIPARSGGVGSLALVYTGHNEFLEFDTDHDLSEQTRFLCDTPIVSDRRRAAVMTTYRNNLEAIIAELKKKGVPVIISALVSNTTDWEPNRSVLSSPKNRDAVRNLALEGEQAFAAGNWEGVRKAYGQILEMEPDFAWAHKRMGDSLSAGDLANTHYLKAKDLDGNPYRALSEQNGILREVARLNNASLIEPVEKGLGYGFFLDNCHPDLSGYIALAELLASELVRLGSAPVISSEVEKSHPDRVALSVDEVRSELGITDRVLYDVYHQRGQYCYSHASLIWYPVARLNRAQHFFDLAGEIEETADLMISRALLAAMRGNEAGTRSLLEQAAQKDPDAVRRRTNNQYVQQLLSRYGIEI